MNQWAYLKDYAAFHPGGAITEDERRAALRRALGLTVFGVCTACILYCFPPGVSRLYPPCAWHLLTHTYCPGCGLLRGLARMTHGDLLGLARENLLAASCLPVLGYAFCDLWTRGLRGLRLPALRPGRLGSMAIVLLIVVFTVARNFLPLLAPTP